MKRILLSALVVFGLGSGMAQSDIIAVSGENVRAIAFKDFRFIDLKGNADKIISKKSFEMPDQVVGMSYDTKNQNIIMIGMHSPDVYAYNLQSGKSTRIYASGRANSKCQIADQFSRMATASNGTTYALNNASNQLIEITPVGDGYAVKELGALHSDIKLNQYNLYGGDLIADNVGNLYLISARSQVVRINPKTMSAEFIGSVDGLDKGFTTNGSAVMSDGSVLLSNAQGKGYYVMDFASLQAKRIKGEDNQPIYDLASPYFLQDSSVSVASSDFLSVYPTKITQREIKIAPKAKLSGMGQVSIYDIAGNTLISSKINLEDQTNVKTIGLNSLSPGNYLIKVVDFNGKELINEKFILLR